MDHTDFLCASGRLRVRGRIDPSKLVGAPTSEVVDLPAPTRHSCKGQEYFTLQTTARGRPELRAELVAAEIAVWADVVAGMEQVIDARQDEAGSLASNEDLVAVARRVSGAGATGAQLSTKVEPSSTRLRSPGAGSEV